MRNLDALCELAEKRGLHVGLLIKEPQGEAGKRPPPEINSLCVVKPERSGSRRQVLVSIACGLESVEKAAQTAITKLMAHA